LVRTGRRAVRKEVRHAWYSHLASARARMPVGSVRMGGGPGPTILEPPGRASERSGRGRHGDVPGHVPPVRLRDRRDGRVRANRGARRDRGGVQRLSRTDPEPVHRREHALRRDSGRERPGTPETAGRFERVFVSVRACRMDRRGSGCGLQRLHPGQRGRVRLGREHRFAGRPRREPRLHGVRGHDRPRECLRDRREGEWRDLRLPSPGRVRVGARGRPVRKRTEGGRNRARDGGLRNWLESGGARRPYASGGAGRHPALLRVPVSVRRPGR